jgi:hypothetical protein
VQSPRAARRFQDDLVGETRVVKYLLEGCFGVAGAIAIATAGASWAADLLGGLIVGVLILVIEVGAWRRSRPPSVRR